MKYIKTNETNEWCISDNGELFTDGYYSREEAIKGVKKGYGCGYIGRQVHVEFGDQDILIPDIEYELGEKLHEEVGEASESWEIPKDLMKKFARKYEKLVIDFINENDLQPTCYKVVDIEEVSE
jgi:hypothetical protein